MGSANVIRSIECILSAATLLFSSVFAVPSFAARTNDPSTSPVPDFEADQQSPDRCIVVDLHFEDTSPTTVTLQSMDWAETPARTNIGNPPHYEVLLYDKAQALVDRFDIWSPFWTFSENEFGTESLTLESEGVTSVVFPLAGDLAEMRVVEVETSQQLITVDLTPVISDFCAANPGHPECSGVTQPNEPPVANDDAVSTNEDTAVIVDVAANDTDPDNNLDPASAVAATQPGSGTLTNHGDGTFTYTPLAAFSGSDSFLYEICDTGADLDPATDIDDLCDSATVTITVLAVNSPPTVQAGEDLSVHEGQALSLTASYFDSDAGDTHTATIEWGDTTSDVITPTGGQFTITHVYADNGVYTVTVTVMDSRSESGTDTLQVDVANVPPENDAIADREVGSGESLSVTLGFTDAGTLDSHDARIDWGDGTTVEPAAVTENPFGPPGSTTGMTGQVNGSHSYVEPGTYSASITVDDDDGGTSESVFTVTVTSPDADGDGIADTMDVCPNTLVPERAPTDGALKPNRWALVSGREFTQAPPQAGQKFSFSLADTRGCSCAQIAESLAAGVSHIRDGCSTSLMLDWTRARDY